MAKMTEARKRKLRLEIVTDAIDQLKAEKYIATSGTYLRFKGRPSKKSNLLDYANEHSCKVCAKGAMFISMLRKTNSERLMGHLSIGGFDIQEEEALEEMFGDMSDELEQAFEGWNDPFYKIQYPDDRDRLIALFCNVKRNKGDFKPEQDEERHNKEVAERGTAVNFARGMRV